MNEEGQAFHPSNFLFLLVFFRILYYNNHITVLDG